MRNTKLYSILEHFSRKEQSSFRKYLSSPYFNSNQDMIDLFEDVIKFINRGSDKNLEKEKLWHKLQPKSPYDDIRFRKYISDLLKLVEGFLAQQVYEKNSLLQAAGLVEAVGHKNMEKLYASTMRTARRLSDKHPYRTAMYYYHQYEIERNFYTLTRLDIKRSEVTNEDKIIQNLDYFYLGEKLRLFCSILSRSSMVKSKESDLFFDEVIKYVKKLQVDDIPAVSIYYQVYLTQTDAENTSHYNKLKLLLRENYHLFPNNQAYEMYTFAMNYCIRRLNKTGKKLYVEELFYFYKELLSNKLIFKDEELSPWDFKNIVTTALRLREYTWTQSFIKTYQEFLPKRQRDNAVSYNLAQLYFYQKKYDDVIQELRNVEFEDFTYNLNSKAMLIATYYETDEIEPLYSMFSSFTAFLRRNTKFSQGKKQNYLNLIKYTKKLDKLRFREKEALVKLKKEVEEARVSSKKWLLEKIDEKLNR